MVRWKSRWKALKRLNPAMGNDTRLGRSGSRKLQILAPKRLKRLRGRQIVRPAAGPRGAPPSRAPLPQRLGERDVVGLARAEQRDRVEDHDRIRNHERRGALDLHPGLDLKLSRARLCGGED